MQLREPDLAACVVFWLTVFVICLAGSTAGNAGESFSVLTSATGAATALAGAMWLHRRYWSQED
jgi:hypothetical protein